MTLRDAERNRGADRVFQTLDGDAGLLKLAVDVHLHSAGQPGTVIADQQMVPLARRDGRVGDYFQCVVRPLMNQVRRQPVVFQPQVPATEAVLVIHAGQQRAGLSRLGKPRPNAVGKRLVTVEIAGLRDLQRDPRPRRKRFFGHVSGVQAISAVGLKVRGWPSTTLGPRRPGPR